MKHYLYLFLALCIGAVVMSCRPKNNPEDPKHPHLGDTEITANSPVGTIGTLDGREAMVVDLGGSIGKVAIATMNVGATATTGEDSYGAYISYDDAVVMSNNEIWGMGWYLPSNDELEALTSHLNKADGYDYYQWAVTNTSILYFPLSGYISPDDAEPLHMGNTAFYSSCTEGEIAEWSRVIHMDQRGAEMWDYYKAGKISVRPFHKMPAPNEITTESPVGTIGMIDGREGIVVDLGGEIGKIVVATMNVGATSVKDGAGSETTATCYGDYISYNDAVSMSKDQAWGMGWYLPSNDELEALLSHLNKADGYDYYQWAVTNTSILYFPLSGYISPDDAEPLHMGNTAFYSSCTEGEIAEWSKVIHMDQKSAEMWDYYKTGKISVRPFHKMPSDLPELTIDMPVGTIGMYKGHEAMIIEIEGLKNVVATMNVGATYSTLGAGASDYEAACYGSSFTLDEAQELMQSVEWRGWRIPKPGELYDIIKMMQDWTTDGKVVGKMITPSSSTNSVYFPYAGTQYNERGDVGYYWSDDKAGCIQNIKTGEDADPSVTRSSLRPTGDYFNEINNSSPVGTIGNLCGHEAIVVDLGGTIGKTAIATMNFGATHPTEGAGSEDTENPVPCYGDLVHPGGIFFEGWTLAGWYLPDTAYMNAVIRHLVPWEINGKYVGYKWDVTESSTLYFPAAGRKGYDDGYVGYGTMGFYNGINDCGLVFESSSIIYSCQHCAAAFDLWRIRLIHEVPQY